MYETKGHDGIVVYKSLHFSLDFTGNYPEVFCNLFKYICNTSEKIFWTCETDLLSKKGGSGDFALSSTLFL